MPKASPEKWWIVRQSAIHQRGVFARVDIPKETPVIEYTGEKITKAESTRRGNALAERAAKTGGAAVYIFTLNKKHDLDGSTAQNTARLINHSCDPNCEAFITRGRIWIYAKRDIKEGEELSFNYGFGMDTWEDHSCRCGTSKCIGYILDEQYWPKLKKILAEREATKKKLDALEARAEELKKELAELDKPTSKKASKKKMPKKR
jgi:SET domain-containing protein